MAGMTAVEVDGVTTLVETRLTKLEGIERLMDDSVVFKINDSCFWLSLQEFHELQMEWSLHFFGELATWSKTSTDVRIRENTFRFEPDEFRRFLDTLQWLPQVKACQNDVLAADKKRSFVEVPDIGATKHCLRTQSLYGGGNLNTLHIDWQWAPRSVWYAAWLLIAPEELKVKRMYWKDIFGLISPGRPYGSAEYAETGIFGREVR